MKNIKKLIFTISILLFNISVVFAEATYEQAMKMNSDGFGTGSLTCSELMGPNIVKLINSGYFKWNDYFVTCSYFKRRRWTKKSK